MSENTQNIIEGDLRYNFSALLVTGNGYISDDRWFDEKTIRTHLQHALRSGRYEQESIEVHIQIRKSRWVAFKHGKVSIIFPDLWAEWKTDLQVEQFIAHTCLEIGQAVGAKKVYRSEINFELDQYGLEAAIKRAEINVEKAKALQTILEGIAVIRGIKTR